MIKFQAVPVTLDAAAGDDAPRTITGVAVPWDSVGVVASGEKVSFRKGAFDVTAKPAKLIEGHDMSKMLGVVNEVVEAEEGLLFQATFAKVPAADNVIELIKAGAYDAVSVGAVPVKYKYDKNGVMVVSKANLVELSVVPYGAFSEAQITEIAASEPEPDSVEADETQPDNIPEEETMSQDTPAVEASAEIVPTTPIYAQAKKFVMPSAGEYLSAQLQGGAVAEEFNARLRAAAPDVVTSDLPGILPTPIVAPIYNNFRGLRPVIDAVGVRAMPAGGKVFIRPVVTTHTSMAVATENTAIQSGTFVVDDVQITKGIYGGYVEVSEASLDWSQPEVLTAMLDDMGRVYANTVDNVAADALEAGTTNTNNFTAANIADPTEWVAWIYQAASDILSGSNGNLPTHLFMAPNRWASLGNLVDDSGRPLFPNIGPMNALGQLAPGDSAGNAFGLQVVVDRNLPSGTLIIGDATSGGFECWEQMKGAVSIEQPSTLSRQIAFRGYFAAKMLDDTKFIKAAFV
jgi:HK97 family phage prohead protease